MNPYLATKGRTPTRQRLPAALFSLKTVTAAKGSSAVGYSLFVLSNARLLPSPASMQNCSERSQNPRAVMAIEYVFPPAIAHLRTRRMLENFSRYLAVTYWLR